MGGGWNGFIGTAYRLPGDKRHDGRCSASMWWRARVPCTAGTARCRSYSVYVTETTRNSSWGSDMFTELWVLNTAHTPLRTPPSIKRIFNTKSAKICLTLLPCYVYRSNIATINVTPFTFTTNFEQILTHYFKKMLLLKFTIILLWIHRWACQTAVQTVLCRICSGWSCIFQPAIVAVTKLHASRSQQNRTTLQHEQRSLGE
jgi:hypothetical protein